MRVAIVGTAERWAVGGLATYQRLLERGLDGSEFLSCWRSERQSRQSSEYAFWLRDEQKRLLRLTTRPFFHGMVVKWLNLRFARCFSMVRDFQPNIIHFVGTGYDLVGFPLQRLAISLGAKFTIWPAIHPGSWGDDAIDLRLYRQADQVFCQSDFESQHLVKLGVPNRQVARCGLPPMCRADGDAEWLRKKLSIGEVPIVFFLGRLDEGKGYYALLNAWKLIRESNPDAILLIAGPGSERPALEGVVDLGVVDEATKAAAYAACDVFCLPSQHESFGIVYVEAWSYGKAVVCGEAPASRELISNGVTGIHGTQSPSDLAEILRKLLNDVSKRTKLGSEGKRVQNEKYTMRTMMDAHLRCWNKCRNGSGY